MYFRKEFMRDCNTTLGKMNDDIDLLTKMINYLKENGDEN